MLVFAAAADVSGQTGSDPPITGKGRVKWAVENTVGWPSLAAGAISAGWGTGFDRPPEYGSHWDGFGKRYGMRLTGIATANAIDASLGAVWGEDPRYFRDGSGQPFGNRLRHVFIWTFVARNREGQPVPAYSRFVALSGSNFLSNTWRPSSEADTSHSAERIGLGLLGRLSKNAFDEFWPDVKERVFRRGR